MENDSPAAVHATPPPSDGDARLRLVLDETGLAIWETDFRRR